MLTDAQAKRASPKDKDYKLADGGGLYLFVTAKGFKSWRMKYRHAGLEKRLTFGGYPEVTLTEARDRRDAARRQLRDLVDPAVERRKSKLASAASASMTFEKLARAWHENEAPRWSTHHSADAMRSLERDVFPDMGALPVRDIDAPTVLATLRKIEKRGSIETARRIRQRVSGIFVFGISEGACATDPAAIVAKAMKPLPKKGQQPAIVELDDVRQVLVATEAAKASPVTKLASRLLALTAVRPGIVLGAQWGEFEELDDAHPIWRVPSSRMKLRLDKKDEEQFDLIVPLSTQAIEAIEAIRRLTGRGKFVFPNHRSSARPMSENAIGYLYNRIGFHSRHVPHGWRAAFSTIMNEKAEREGRASDRKVIDLMLAHVPKDKIEGAYNRAAYMPRRREIAQEWADMLCVGLMPTVDLLDGARR